jgi:hypothetical protein
MTVQAAFHSGKPRMVNYDPGSSTVHAGDVDRRRRPALRGAHADIPAFTGAKTLDALAVGGGCYAMTADASLPDRHLRVLGPHRRQGDHRRRGQHGAVRLDRRRLRGALSDSAGTAVLVAHEPVLPGGIPYNIGATANDNISNTTRRRRPSSRRPSSRPRPCRPAT